MKWAFLSFLVLLVPVLAIWLRSAPEHAPKAWFALGFLPFVLGPGNLYIAPISWAWWPGYVKGAEVSILDAVALGVLLSMHRKPTSKTPFRWVFGLYVFAVAVSAVISNVPMAAGFYVWQLLRVALLFVAVAKVCVHERGRRAITTGLALGLLLQAIVAIGDRYSGAVQTGGTFGHQNLLGMVSFFVTFPAFAALLGGTKGPIPAIGTISGLVVASLGASRATIGLTGLGFILVLVLSGFRKWTTRKMRVALLGAVFLTAAGAVAISSLEKRFSVNPLGEYDERAAFEQAASMIFKDHPMGIGANQYVITANVDGYSERAGVIPTPASRSAHVHHLYLLTAAETGIIGASALIIFFSSVLIFVFGTARKFWSDPRSEQLIGIGVACVIMMTHSFFEWVFVTFHMQYMFALSLGIAAGIARQLNDSQVRRHSKKRCLKST